MIKIMIVEDDIPASTFLADVLMMEGYEVIVVNESWKTMEIAHATIPEAFLLDLMMPPPDGFKLCRMLRADSLFKYAPILVVTALDNTDSKIVAIGAGANDYLVKPFRIDDLRAKVRELIDDKLSLEQTTSNPEPQNIRFFKPRLDLLAFFDLLNSNLLWFLLAILILSFCILIKVLP